VGHASRSGVLRCMEASGARIFQSGLNSVRGVTVSGAHNIIMKVAWSSSRRRTSRYDGLRQTLLSQNHCF
jgi:hypothetical protein